jgi:hypothetical protein
MRHKNLIITICYSTSSGTALCVLIVGDECTSNFFNNNESQ